MAPALVQSNLADSGFASGSTLTCAFSSPLTSGNIIIVWATIAVNTTITITDTVNTYTQVSSRYWSNIGYQNVMAWAQNTSSSALTVTATYGAAGTIRSLVVAEFSGVATTTPVDVSTAGKDNSATTAPTDVAMTTTQAGDLVIAGIGSDGASCSAGSGYTLVRFNATTACTGMEYQVQGSAGSITTAWTQATAVQATILSAAFKASGGGGGPAIPPLLIMQTRRSY